MKRTRVSELRTQLDGKEVLLQGWVHELRDLKKIKFLLLRDQSGIVQTVGLEKSLDKETFTALEQLTPESTVSINGTVKANKEAKQGFEVVINKLEVLSTAASLPIQVFEKDKTITTDLSKRLDNRPIDLRKPEVNAIFTIQSKLLEGMQQHLQKEGFQQVFTPCIMGVASESGAEVFKVKYYDKEAFLRQDPQLHRELAVAGGIEKLYDLGPSWRAELSHTTRHLCEHRVCAPEMAFIKDEYDVITCEEALIVATVKHIKEHCQQELDLLGVKLEVPKTPFPVLLFPDLYDLLKKLGKELPKGEDLDTEAMKLLGDYMKKEHKADFYFINKFPSSIKPFYVMYDENPENARSVDLNYGSIELSSGGQREHRYDKIMAQAKEKDMSAESVEWFAKHFKYGCPPLGGFAIGIERLTQVLLGLENIKEGTLFVRDPERLQP